MSLPIASMTGFARSEGVTEGLAWAWELRSVNGRGLELRMRLAPGLDALEAPLRELAATALKRGNVTANLTTRRDEQPRITPDPAALEQVLTLALDLARRIPGTEPPRAESLLALPGVLRPAPTEITEAVAAAQGEAIRRGFVTALDALIESRRAEGARLAETLHRMLDEIAALRARATTEAAGQPQGQRTRMLDTLQTLLPDQSGFPEERIAQEIALLAARADVREELDRLESHIQAARALLAEGANIGRRFDFLVQEFNREANTLCSKSASIPLTTTGLALKAAIDQLREQIQNVE
jgi:uncharacterized protein (TIGR00255 family)